MPRQYKINKERCSKCKYQMNISSGYSGKELVGKFCGYSTITGHSRCFKDGGYRSDYRPGYCQVYEEREGNKRAAGNPGHNDIIFIERGQKSDAGNEEGIY